jgi:sodium/potassium/calcium exchanger 6
MITNGGLSMHFGPVPLYAIVEPIALLLSVAVWFTTGHEKPPKYKAAFLAAAFVLSVIWIYLIANEIVSLLEVIIYTL